MDVNVFLSQSLDLNKSRAEFISSQMKQNRRDRDSTAAVLMALPSNTPY